MMKKLPRLAWGLVPLVVFILSGCAELQPVVMLDPPMVESEGGIAQDVTLLEQFQQVTRRYELEKAQVASLEAQLSAETVARQRAEAEAESRQAEVAALEKSLEVLSDIETKFNNAQQVTAELSERVRELQQDLVAEQLMRIKVEQKLVELKIERARERRRQMIEEHNRLKQAESNQGSEEKEQQGARL